MQHQSHGKPASHVFLLVQAMQCRTVTRHTSVQISAYTMFIFCMPCATLICSYKLSGGALPERSHQQLHNDVLVGASIGDEKLTSGEAEPLPKPWLLIDLGLP